MENFTKSRATPQVAGTGAILLVFTALFVTIYTPFNFGFHLPGSTETFRGEGLNTPSPDLINEYEAGDARKDLSSFASYTDLQSNQFVRYPFTLKLYDPLWRYPGQNVEIIRYAYILLLYAELTNDPVYLNQVWARAVLPAYGSAG